MNIDSVKTNTSLTMTRECAKCGEKGKFRGKKTFWANDANKK